jgi:hypothetical protein
MTSHMVSVFIFSKFMRNCDVPRDSVTIRDLMHYFTVRDLMTDFTALGFDVTPAECFFFFQNPCVIITYYVTPHNPGPHA